MIWVNKKVQLLLILIGGMLSVETFAQKSFVDAVNDDQISLPIVKIGFSGHIGLTGKYDLSVRTIKNLNLNLYYGNRSLDYLHLASTTDERWYGAGVEYYFTRYGNTFFSGAMNFYHRGLKGDGRNGIPNRVLYVTSPLVGVTGIDKSTGLYYHVKAGWGQLAKSLDQRSDHSYFNKGLSLDVGIGIGFGCRRKNEIVN